MRQVWVMVQAKLRMARHQIAGVRHESKLKVGVISVAAVGLWAGAFIFFYSGFNWLIDFGGRGGEFNFGNLLMNRMLSILALSVFLMLIFSNVLVVFSTLYRSREVAYLLQAPISYEQFFYVRFLECVVFSSWALAFLGSPLMLAYGLSTQAPLLFYAVAVLFFVPFIVVPACIGAFITMVLVHVFPRLKVRVMAILGAVAGGVFFFYIRGIIQSTRAAEDALMPMILEASARTQSPFLPSFWASEGVLSAARHDSGHSLFWFLTLLSTALACLWVTGASARFLFYPGWSFLMGQDRQRFKRPGRGMLAWVERALGPVRNPERVLVMKDIRLFWRDPTQWSQFVIFFGIMALYIANLRNTSRFYEQAMWRSFIACLNVGAVTLILATLTSRFVFPLVSLEGRRFWILGLAPLSIGQLVWQKFWLSVATTSMFTVGLAVLSGLMLDLEPVYLWLTIYSVVITNFGLAGLAVGLGALYPTFTEDNPARIVSGMGGTLNLLVSIGYITLMVTAQTVILQWRVLERFARPQVFWYALGGVVVFITLLSVACTFVPMRLGLRNLRQLEF